MTTIVQTVREVDRMAAEVEQPRQQLKWEVGEEEK